MGQVRERASGQASSVVGSTRIDAPILLDISGLVALPIVRTIGDNTLIGAWVIALLILAIRWPGSGLGLAAALAVFPQPTAIGFAPSVALIAASSIGFALDLVLRGYPDGAMRPRLQVVVVGVITLAATTFVALQRSQFRLDPEIAVEASRRWIEFGAGLAFFVLLLRAFSMGSKRPLLLGLIGISAGLTVALIDAAAPGFLRSIGMRWLVPADSNRATGPFISPNRLGSVAGIMVIVGACQALLADRWRWLWAGFAVVSLVALLVSFSRGALLGLVVAGGVILAIRSRRAAVGYLVVVALLAVIAVPLYVGARLSGSGGSLEILLTNDLGRFDAWFAGIRMIQAEPIFGHGFSAFRELGESFGATDGLLTAHNEFIGFWAESGVLALAAYVATAAAIVACALKRRTEAWAIAAIGAVALFLVATSFNLQSIFLAVTCPFWLVVAYGIERPLRPDTIEPSSSTPTT